MSSGGKLLITDAAKNALSRKDASDALHVHINSLVGLDVPSKHVSKKDKVQFTVTEVQKRLYYICLNDESSSGVILPS